MTPARLACSWAVANKHSGYESKTAYVEVSNISGHEYLVEWPGLITCVAGDHRPHA